MKALAVLLALVSTGCAPEPSIPTIQVPTDDPAPAVQPWERVDVRAGSDEYPRIRIAVGPEALVISDGGGDDRRGAFWVSRGASAWQRIDVPVAKGIGFIEMNDVLWAGDRFVATVGVTTGPSMDPPNAGPFGLVYESKDGLSWTPTFGDFSSEPASIWRLARTSLGIVGLGESWRDELSGPRPGIWLSRTPGSWERVLDVEPDGGAAAAYEASGKLFVTGSLDQDAVIWASADGRTWSRPAVPDDIFEFGPAARRGDRVFLAGTSSDSGQTIWSTTDGEGWERLTTVESFGGSAETMDTLLDEADVYELERFGDHLVARARLAYRTHPGWCWVDVKTCGREAVEVLLSRDGAIWDRLNPGRYGDAQVAAISAVGEELLIAGFADGRLSLWRGTDLGELLPITSEATPDLPFEIVRSGATLEEDVIYGYRQWTHCGIGHLGEFNGTRWAIAERVEDGPPPEEWPMRGEELYGTIRRSGDRIEYSVPAGVLAVYRPTDEEPPGCA